MLSLGYTEMEVFFLVIIWLHVLADFILRTDEMALKKSKSIVWLSYHVLVYSIPFLVIFGWRFALVNGVAHWLVDFFTSKITSFLWKKGDRHLFFVTIGIDQALHLSCLALSYFLL